MVERRLTWWDQAGLPQPDRTGLLASAGGHRVWSSRRWWPIDLPKIEGHEQGRTQSGWRAHGQRCRLGGADATRQVCTVTQIWKFLTARLLTVTSGAFCPSPSCPHVPCLVHACANVLLVHVCHTSCVWIDLSHQAFAYDPPGGRVHAPLRLCVHAHCVICSDGATPASRDVGACIFLSCNM